MSADIYGSNGLPCIFRFFNYYPVKMIKAFMYNIIFPTVEVPISLFQKIWHKYIIIIMLLPNTIFILLFC